jgi:hypothetical protein
MPTLSKPKNSKQKAKKEFLVKSPEAGESGILEAAEKKAEFLEVSSEEKHQLIAKAAYFRAEQRSFSPGRELEDWLEAEAEVEKNISQNTIGNLMKNI